MTSESQPGRLSEEQRILCERIIAKNFNLIRKRVYRVMNSSIFGDDVVQEVCIAICQAIQNQKLYPIDTPQFFGWLRTTVLNACRNRLKHERKMRGLPPWKPASAKRSDIFGPITTVTAMPTQKITAENSISEPEADIIAEKNSQLSFLFKTIEEEQVGLGLSEKKVVKGMGQGFSDRAISENEGIPYNQIPVLRKRAIGKISNYIGGICL